MTKMSFSGERFYAAKRSFPSEWSGPHSSVGGRENILDVVDVALV